MRTCDVCGRPIKGASCWIGRALACRTCEPDLKAEIEKERMEGKPVSAIRIAKRMFRENYSSDGEYLLRDLPNDLWQKVKHRAVDDGDSLRGLILKALYTYIREIYS